MKGGSKGESDNGWREGQGWAWKLKFAQLNKVKAGGGEGGEGAVSIQLLPCEKRRRSDGEGMWAAGWARGVAVCQCCTVLAQRCHCQMLTSWVWLHSPSSKWASVYTEWTRLKKQADSGETVSRDVTGTVILLIWSMKDNFTFQVSFGLIFKGRTSLLCINDVWAHLFTTERQHLH